MPVWRQIVASVLILEDNNYDVENILEDFEEKCEWIKIVITILGCELSVQKWCNLYYGNQIRLK